MKNPNILIFGDQKSENKIALQLLENFYEVNVLSFEQSFSYHTKQLILVIILQTTSGDHGLNKLKEIRRFHPRFPILFIMQKPDQENIVELFREGTSDFLTWPVNPHQLISRIQQLFEINQTLWLHPTGKIKNLFLRLRKWIVLLWKKTSKQNNYKHQLLKPVAKSAALLPLPALDKPAPKEAVLSVCFLDKMRIRYLDSSELVIKGKKTKSLLAYLIYHHKRPVHRDVLMNNFWPFTSDTCARNSLNVCLHQIRKAFKNNFGLVNILLYDNGYYSFDTAIKFDLDTDHFSRNWKRGASLEQSKGLAAALEDFHYGIALYHRDFLEEMRYEPWTEPIRENLRETYLAILAKLSLHHFEQNNFSITINLCKKILAKDNCLEEIHHRLIFSLFKLGMRDRAIRQFHKCRQTLNEELKIEPSQEIINLLEKIKKVS